jgi:Fur family transcriptional regulator, ferric uptake regulator
MKLMARKWEQQLHNNGYRITTSRRAVMEVLREAQEPLSAQELLVRGRKHHRALGIVTVYRTLDLLSELGLVRRVHRSDGCHGYLGASPGHHHAILCVHCGRATEFHGQDDLIGLLGRVRRETGFEVDDHLLQLYGTCAECQTHDL